MNISYNHKLNDVVTKEKGGRHGGKGHEFQRYWALCHLLERDLTGKDYLVLMEFIEDIAILNSPDQPNEIDLYQVKKSEKVKWTKAKLINSKKGSQSIVAKLLESQVNSPIPNAIVSFVSNAPVEFKLTSGLDSTSLASFNITDLDSDLIDELKANIACELKREKKDIDLNNLIFIKSPLSLNDLETHSTGVVANYLSKKHPDHNARADVLMKALYSEIKLKATNTEDASSFGELRKLRGITKGQFEDMLSQVLARKPTIDVLDDAVNNLEKDGVPFAQRKSIKDAGRRYFVDRLNQSNQLLITLEDEVDKLKNSTPADLISIWKVAQWIHSQLKLLPNWHSFSPLGDSYIDALILYGISK